jgi:signal transduction histidine kinase
MAIPSLGRLSTRLWPAWFSSRQVLLIGFGGLLILMAVAGGDALSVLGRLRSTNAEIQRTFLLRNAALDRIRSGIYLSGTYARDYLLAVEQSGADRQRQRLRAIESDTRAAMDEYEKWIDRSEERAFNNLRGEITAYWKLLDYILDSSTAEKRRSGQAYFSDDLVHRRTAMLGIADQISDINARELNAADSRISREFGRFRFRLALTLVITLGGGLLLAALATFHLLGLEREARKRYDESVRAQAELKELSARLVSAQEEERKAIARELHDEVGQSLSALLVEIGNAMAVLPAGSDEIRSHIASIRTLAENSVHVIRNMSLLLRPSMLDDLGLVPALEWQAREVSKRTGLRVRIRASGAVDDLPDAYKTCIYRVVQEALHNCARHAHAHSAEVDVDERDGEIRLTIVDDGRGFNANHVRGLGLLGMEERITHLGGSFHVHSEEMKGTRILVELPFVSARTEHAYAADSNSTG